MKKVQKKIKAWAVLYGWGEIANLPDTYTPTKSSGYKAIITSKKFAKMFRNFKSKDGLLHSIVPCTITYDVDVH